MVTPVIMLAIGKSEMSALLKSHEDLEGLWYAWVC